MDVVVAMMAKSQIAQQEMLGDYFTDLLARTYLKTALFSSDTQITPTTVLAGLIECSFTGYARQTIASFNGPFIDQASGLAYGTTPELVFRGPTSGSGANVYNCAILGTIPGSVVATATVTTTMGVISAPVITAAGGPYSVPPNITVAGGGTNAVVTCTLNGSGGVDTVTVMDGGSGYTDATLIFDPPVEIVAFNNFANPSQLNVSTDALPLIQYLTVPS